MRGFWLLFTLAFGIETPTWADHQRVASQSRETQRWETSLGMSLNPWGPLAWDAAVCGRLGYEYDRTWGLSLSCPLLWSLRPEFSRTKVRWGEVAVGGSWTSASAEPRWRAGLSTAWAAWAEGEPGPVRITGDLGVSVVRDPAVLGLSASVAVPFPGTLDRRVAPGGTGSLALSFQEVVNDNLAWTLDLGPRISWSDASRGTGTVREMTWDFSVSWGLGWYEAPYSLATTAGAEGSGGWSLSATAGRSW